MATNYKLSQLSKNNISINWNKLQIQNTKLRKQVEQLNFEKEDVGNDLDEMIRINSCLEDMLSSLPGGTSLLKAYPNNSRF